MTGHGFEGSAAQSSSTCWSPHFSAAKLHSWMAPSWHTIVRAPAALGSLLCPIHKASLCFSRLWHGRPRCTVSRDGNENSHEHMVDWQEVPLIFRLACLGAVRPWDQLNLLTADCRPFHFSHLLARFLQSQSKPLCWCKSSMSFYFYSCKQSAAPPQAQTFVFNYLEFHHKRQILPGSFRLQLWKGQSKCLRSQSVISDQLSKFTTFFLLCGVGIKHVPHFILHPAEQSVCQALRTTAGHVLLLAGQVLEET